MTDLVPPAVLEELARAATVEALAKVVVRAARSLTRAHGCTFLRSMDGHCCYVDEDSVLPLWKGQ